VKLRYFAPISALMAAATLAVALPPALAHHSAAPFDMSKTISVSGTVEKWVWSNPHSWLYLSVKKSDGTKQVWGFEAGSAGMMARNGWNSKDMKPGDKVTVTAFPARNGKPVGLVDKVKLSSGKVLGGGFGAPPPGATAPPRPGKY
jgi:Family of unknown function (DUF6152)